MVPSIRFDNNRCIELSEYDLTSLLDSVYSDLCTDYDELCRIISITDTRPCNEDLKSYRATFLLYTSLLQFVYSFCNLSVWRYPDGYHKLVNLCSGDSIPLGAVNVLPFDD